MSRVERILSEIEALTPPEQDELYAQLIDFDQKRTESLLKRQQSALHKLIGIASVDFPEVDHDTTLAQAKLASQE